MTSEPRPSQTFALRGLYSNAVYTAWSAVLGLCAVPILLSTLGLESYALVALLITVQSILVAFDMGLSSTVNRFVARYLAQNNALAASRLLSSLSPVYWSVAILVVCFGVFCSDYLAVAWLNLVELPQGVVSTAFLVICLIVATRWCLALYQQALIGAGRVDLSSRIGVLTVSLAQIGGVIVAYYSHDVRFYLFWLLVCAVIQLTLLYFSAWKILGNRRRARWEWQSLKSVWKFSFSMAGVSLTGAILMQADRLLLSRTQLLDEFGVYSLAWVLTGGLYVILTPTFNFIAPRLTALFAAQSTAYLRSEYRRLSRVFFAVLFPIVAMGAVCSSELLGVWVGNSEIAQRAAMPFSILFVATGLNGVMHFPFALQLAAGRGELALKINLVLCVFYFPALYLLSMLFGTLGAASAWLLINLLYCVYGLPATRRSISAHPNLFPWLTQDAFPPFAMSSLAAIAVILLKFFADLPDLLILVVATSFGLLCIGLSLRLYSGIGLRDLHWPRSPLVPNDGIQA